MNNVIPVMRLAKNGKWMNVSGISEATKKRALKISDPIAYKRKQINKIDKILDELIALGLIEDRDHFRT